MDRAAPTSRFSAAPPRRASLTTRGDIVGGTRPPYSGHSLRAGFATPAAQACEHERSIMPHTRHRPEQVPRAYTREGALPDEDPTDGAGL